MGRELAIKTITQSLSQILPASLLLHFLVSCFINIPIKSKNRVLIVHKLPFNFFIRAVRLFITRTALRISAAYNKIYQTVSESSNVSMPIKADNCLDISRYGTHDSATSFSVWGDITIPAPSLQFEVFADSDCTGHTYPVWTYAGTTYDLEYMQTRGSCKPVGDVCYLGPALRKKALLTLP